MGAYNYFWVIIGLIPLILLKNKYTYNNQVSENINIDFTQGFLAMVWVTSLLSARTLFMEHGLFGTPINPNVVGIFPFVFHLLVIVISILILRINNSNVSDYLLLYNLYDIRKTLKYLLIFFLVSIPYLFDITSPKSLSNDKMAAFATALHFFPLVVFVFSSLVLGPITEEITFRCLLYLSIYRKVGKWPAIFIVSIVFSILHNILLYKDLQLFLATAAKGVLLAWIYDKKGEIIIPIIIHSFFNLYFIINIIALRIYY